MVYLNKNEGYVIRVDADLFLSRNKDGELGFYPSPFSVALISEENREGAFKLMMEQQAGEPDRSFRMVKATRYIMVDLEDESKEPA